MQTDRQTETYIGMHGWMDGLDRDMNMKHILLLEELYIYIYIYIYIIYIYIYGLKTAPINKYINIIRTVLPSDRHKEIRQTYIHTYHICMRR